MSWTETRSMKSAHSMGIDWPSWCSAWMTFMWRATLKASPLIWSVWPHHLQRLHPLHSGRWIHACVENMNLSCWFTSYSVLYLYIYIYICYILIHNINKYIYIYIVYIYIQYIVYKLYGQIIHIRTQSDQVHPAVPVESTSRLTVVGEVQQMHPEGQGW